jgi:hypothetical protein
VENYGTTNDYMEKLKLEMEMTRRVAKDQANGLLTFDPWI